MTNVVETGSEGKKNIISMAKGCIAALIITSVAIFIFSIVLTCTNVSENVIPVVTTIITGISILIGASLSTISIRKNGFLYGSVIGFFYVFVLYLLSSILSNDFSLNLTAIIMIIVALVTGAVGGIVGVNMKK